MNCVEIVVYKCDSDVYVGISLAVFVSICISILPGELYIPLSSKHFTRMSKYLFNTSRSVAMFLV